MRTDRELDPQQHARSLLWHYITQLMMAAELGTDSDRAYERYGSVDEELAEIVDCIVEAASRVAERRVLRRLKRKGEES